MYFGNAGSLNMRLTIPQKLLLMVLLITALVVVSIAIATRYSIITGFSSYVDKSELLSIDEVGPLLENEYARTGNWAFIQSDPQSMWQIIRSNESIHRNRPGGPPGGGPEEAGGPPEGPSGQAGPRGEPPPFPPFRTELFSRIGLFDASGKLLWGNDKAQANSTGMVLHSNGKEIGTLKLAPSFKLNKEIDESFVAEQNRNLLIVCLFAFAVAPVAAFALSRHLVEAIDRLLEGTRKLTQGDLTTRIELSRSDELGQLAKDFNTLAVALEQHDRAHKQWLTDASHELRTPVAILRAQVEALQDGVQQPSQKTLGVLHNEIMSLGKLIDDLHDLAKSDVGESRLRFLPVEINAILTDSMDGFQERFDKKKVTLDGSGIGPECIVKGDGRRLKQLFTNLMENSLRYTDENGVLKISTSVDKDKLIISFDDTEPGVPEEKLSLIFERFYRVDSSRSRTYGGAGLGLSICKAIATEHGGGIRAVPSKSGGVKMEVTLPVAGEERKYE